MSTKKVRKVVELTISGFITESTTQLRSGYIIDSYEMLDPYPDAYKVFMKRVTVKKKGKPSEKRVQEYLIARPMDGHIPKGGYDLFHEQEIVHFITFSDAKHECDQRIESFIQQIILKEPLTLP